VEENSPEKKRLVLTTVHDNQRSVQIDLYKSDGRTMEDAFYIGSLVMENLKPRPKGAPSIELVITATVKRDITAEAIDLDPSVKGEHQTLSVSLRSMDEDNREYELPDFELETSEAAPTGLYAKSVEAREKEKRGRFPWLVVVCAALILTAIGLAVWLLLFRDWSAAGTGSSPPRTEVQNSQEPAPSAAQAAPAAQPAPAASPAAPPPAQPAPAAQAVPQAAQQQPSAPPQVVQAPPAAQAAPPPVIQAPAAAPAASQTSRTRNPPVASYRVPATIPREGAPYTIRWGDTLWDIADAFYRNPWLYPRIARFNNIRNPDRIISGTTIRVPPRD
jgi:hypothetical protein